MDIKRIRWENIPCWYELSWREKEPAIILRIHQDFITNVKVNLNKAPIVKDFKNEFKFSGFNGDFKRNIGFENVFERRGIKYKFVEFAVKIPKVKILTEKKCGNCKGSGKDEFRQDKCLHCEGTGKEDFMDWQAAYAISASFSVFLMLLHSCEKDTSASSPQLMTVKTMTKAEAHGGSLAGDISIPLRQWLCSIGQNDNGQIPEMVQAMQIAYDKMLGLREWHKFSFRASVRKNGGFVNDCPGDACGLHPYDWYMEEGKGYEFSCHNVDSPMQQITLLAGLAALCDRARREIFKGQ
ncbi:MAG: hypothetical protein WC475_01570 [Candidatus Paceibacterota bacterium]